MLRQLEAFAAVPVMRPDLALGPRDLRVQRAPDGKQPGRASITVHNIGSAPAADVRLEVFAKSADSGKSRSVFQQQLGTLDDPADLVIRKKTVTFEWRSPFAGRIELEARVRCDAGRSKREINSQNNRASVAVGRPGSRNLRHGRSR